MIIALLLTTLQHRYDTHRHDAQDWHLHPDMVWEVHSSELDSNRLLTDEMHERAAAAMPLSLMMHVLRHRIEDATWAVELQLVASHSVMWRPLLHPNICQPAPCML